MRFSMAIFCKRPHPSCQFEKIKGSPKHGVPLINNRSVSPFEGDAKRLSDQSRQLITPLGN